MDQLKDKSYSVVAGRDCIGGYNIKGTQDVRVRRHAPVQSNGQVEGAALVVIKGVDRVTTARKSYRRAGKY
jgi:hypothetical protein